MKKLYEVNYVKENKRMKAKLKLVQSFQAPPQKVVSIKKPTTNSE